MKTLSVVFFASPKIAIPPLQALLENKHFEVISVVTQSPKEVGRGQNIAQTPVCDFAKLNKLIVHHDDEIKKIEQHIRNETKEQPDFLVVCAYGKILPQSLLEIPRFGAINIHFSLLPKYRGASPIQEALLQGDNATGITFITMNEELDAGNILLQESLIIENDDTADTLSEKLSRLSAKLLPRVLLDIAEGRATSLPQDKNRVTFCRKIKKEDGLLDPEKETALEMFRKIRAYTPWPGTSVTISGKRLKILYATPLIEQKISSNKWLIEGENLIFGTKQGCLVIHKIQPEGKREMLASEFIRGYRKLLS